MCRRGEVLHRYRLAHFSTTLSALVDLCPGDRCSQDFFTSPALYPDKTLGLPGAPRAQLTIDPGTMSIAFVPGPI